MSLIIANTPRSEGPRNLAMTIALGKESIFPIIAEKDITPVNLIVSFFSVLRLFEFATFIFLNIFFC
jgi:hypothetical protein